MIFGEIWLRLQLDSFNTKALSNLPSAVAARPMRSHITINYPSKNNSAPCTCLFTHNYTDEWGYRNDLRCCINVYKLKALAKKPQQLFSNRCTRVWMSKSTAQPSLEVSLASLRDSVTGPLPDLYPRRAFFSPFISLQYKLEAVSLHLQWRVALLESPVGCWCRTDTR